MYLCFVYNIQRRVIFIGHSRCSVASSKHLVDETYIKLIFSCFIRVIILGVPKSAHVHKTL